MPATTQNVRFPRPGGGHLAGRLEMPDGDRWAGALFAHCFTCTKDYKATVRISRILAEHGIAVLRFDFAGLGESGGEFAATDFSSNLEDLVAAADFMRQRVGGAQLLIGHSLGGAAVLAAVARIPEARAVATIAAPSDTAHLGDLLRQRAPDLMARGEASVRIGPSEVRIRRSLIDDLDEDHMSRAIGELRVPLLVFHSRSDETLDIEHANRIFAMAPGAKSFIALDGADHLLSNRREDSRFVGRMLLAWSEHYLRQRS